MTQITIQIEAPDLEAANAEFSKVREFLLSLGLLQTMYQFARPRLQRKDASPFTIMAIYETDTTK